jgi:hypothetical protein
MFSYCPPSPPADHTQRPPLPERGEHEAVLPSSSTEAVCRVRPVKSSLCSELRQHFLNCFVDDLFLHVNHAIDGNMRKHKVIGLELPTKLHLKKFDPDEKMLVHVDLEVVSLFVYLVCIP